MLGILLEKGVKEINVLIRAIQFSDRELHNRPRRS
jgi:hypothetical protein